MLKLRDVLSGWEAGRLSQLEAAEVLGMSERTFRRWSKRFDEEGEEGLCDRRLGRRSGRAVPDEEADEVERLYRERYAGFTARHFHEHLRQHHGFRWGYTWTRTYLQGRVSYSSSSSPAMRRFRALTRVQCSFWTSFGRAEARDARAMVRSVEDLLARPEAMRGAVWRSASHRRRAL